MNDQRTDEQLNRIIAEWLPMKLFMLQKRGLYYRPGSHGYTSDHSEAWKLPMDDAKNYEYNPRGCDDPVRLIPAPTPNYCQDLNACHEAEKRMRDNQFNFVAYARVLWEVVFPEVSYTGELGYLGFTYVTATARQRAEALVRVIEQQKTT